MLFARLLTIALLVVMVTAESEEDEYDPTELDNFGADSQTLYKYVRVPVKHVKYLSSFGPDHQLPQLFKNHPVFSPKPRKGKPIFTPNPKYHTFASFRATAVGTKGGYSNKFPEIYRPIHPNFYTDLATVNLPLSFKEPGKFEFVGAKQSIIKQQNVPSFYRLQQEFLQSASPKQVEQFLEDQQKQRDENLELQLLNDPNPEAKGRYQQFLKAKEDERIEMEAIEEMRKTGNIPDVTYFPSSVSEQAPIKKSETPGLRHYRTLDTDPSAYELEISLPSKEF